MPYCRNPVKFALLLAVCLAGLLGLTGAARAGSIEPSYARLSAGEDAYALSAEFQIDLGSHLEDAVSRGVPLYFVLELEITRTRWYFYNEHVAGRSLNYRLAYVPLTRQYRLSIGGTLHQNFTSLEEALRVLSRVAALPVADKGVLKAGDTYQVALRLALDRQQLPKPLQVDAIANKDWQVEAKVLRWQFIPGSASTQQERESK